MSMNKFMHPRNPYFKNPPNFKQLAIDFPEFRKFASTDLSGKVKIDFKDPATLRALTTCLLHHDFGLDVEIPSNRLVPTLPLRLNYLLWIQDLLELAGVHSNIKGIDIGTGACCIYPLLAAKQWDWTMLGTEVDEESVQHAQKNVEKNNLQRLITVSHMVKDAALLSLLGEDSSNHFVMCNPPFFSHEDDTDSVGKGRSPSRTPPSGAPTGAAGEVVAPGGEVAFVQSIIQESKRLQQAVLMYTSMLGHKRSVSAVIEMLLEAEVSSWCRTEFCQGNTTRWGVAWTFSPRLKLPQPCKQLVPNKKLETPMSFPVNQGNLHDTDFSVEGVTTKIKKILNELQMEQRQLKAGPYMCALQITAYSNTWSNQRKRRRQQQRQQQEEGGNQSSATDQVSESLSGPSAKLVKLPVAESASTTSHLSVESTSSSSQSIPKDNSSLKFVPRVLSGVKKPDSCVTAVGHGSSGSNGGPSTSVGTSQSRACLLQCQLAVRKVAEQILVELVWVGGSGGRDTMYQVLQCLRNKLHAKA